MNRALEKAAEHCGSVASLARAIGIKPQAIYQWDDVPIARCLAIEEATDGVVSRYELRPDVFGEPPKSERAA